MQTTDRVQPNELRAQPVSSLLPRLFRDVSSLITQEARLAKAELIDKSGATVQAARTFTFFVACAATALLSLTACVIAALSSVMALWLAFLIVGLIYAVGAAVFGAMTRATVDRAGGLLPSRAAHIFAPLPPNERLLEDRLAAELAKRRVDETLAALGRKTDLLPPVRNLAMALGSVAVTVAAMQRSEEPAPANGRDQ